MATRKIAEKTQATQVNESFNLLVTQKEIIGGQEKDALRRMPESVYEWSGLPSDLRLAIGLMLNGLRQVKWRQEDIRVQIGTTTLVNTLKFPFSNASNTMVLFYAEPNTNYIVLTEVTSFVGNVGEVEIKDKLINGFKISYTGSAESATIRYIVIGGFSE